MTSPEQPQDSPVGWVKEHIDRYVATDGAEGHEWNGTTTLLLTTTGRKSGQPRRTALIYQPDGPNHIVVASNGGATREPAWWSNLKQNPEAQVQVRGDKFTARARVATPEEKPRLWKLMTQMWPDYDEYQKKTDREIPVVILERI